jgi:hypothetical protein
MSPLKSPLQNRVHPSGEIFAVAERGFMLGNRGGKFHRDDKTLGKRRWASSRWICCELHYKNIHHEAMGRGYTSLFFLDEVTALAAGHRPCFFCRRGKAKDLVRRSGLATTALDQQLQQERTSPRRAASDFHLCDGAMIEQDGEVFALRDSAFLQWSFAGYAKTHGVSLSQHAKLLTPPTILAILRGGYQPRWHQSALRND